jgi:tRNA dimethylallyltransferase
MPIIVIVGPTASGKTSLSIKIATSFDGEVISADSRQVYRGLDIGSGKVTKAEMADIPHHLLDVADPQTVYSASDFKRDATRALADVMSRGRLPIIAGGTFFYVDTLLGDISFPQVPPNDELRSELETKSVEDLYITLSTLDPDRALTIDKDNPRRLIRAIEIATALGKVPTPVSMPSSYRSLKLGVDIDRDTLHANIHTRLITRLEDGMVAEVEGLIAAGVTHKRLESFGLEYRYISRYLQGQLPYDDMVTELETKIRQFAKRQYTWLKRDSDILWVNPHDEALIHAHITDFLAPNPIPTI